MARSSSASERIGRRDSARPTSSLVTMSSRETLTMSTLVVGSMAKKKSEARKHTAMIRVDSDALDRAKLASSLMRMSLADWVSDLIRKAAEKDIAREAKKLAGGGDQ